MSPIFIPFFAVLLISFYLSLTTASVLPRDDVPTRVPKTCSQSNVTFTSTFVNTTTSLNDTASSNGAVCLPSYSRRTPITINSCQSALRKILQDGRDTWIAPRYAWRGIGSDCIIVLKAEKLPAGGGSRIYPFQIYDAAHDVLAGCVDFDQGGLGGSVGMETQAQGIAAGEWRVWVYGKSKNVVGVDKGREDDDDDDEILDLAEPPCVN